MVKPVKITEVVSDCFKSPSELPPEQLAKRIETAKKYFLQSIERDCRQTTEFLDEWRGKELYKHFCESWEEFCSKYFERPAEWLDYIADGLKLLDNAKPIPAAKALEALEKINKPGRPPKVTEEQHAQILELRSQGLSQEQIANHVGVDQKTVSNNLRRNHDNIIISPKAGNNETTSAQGTSQEYLLRKIKTEKPEFLDDIGKGKRFKSVRAAAIEAGIVKRSFSIQIREDSTPQQIADRLARKLTTEQISELAFALVCLVQEQNHREGE